MKLQNKIMTGLPKLDEEMSKGLAVGEISLFIGSTGKSDISGRMLEAAIKAGKTVILDRTFEMFDPKLADKITEAGMKSIDEIKDVMKDFIPESYEKVFTSHEKIGDAIYPVTYFPNGMVLMDYPSLLPPKKND